jgi:hypothetical protein
MFSLIAPLDANRLEQFKQTKEVYDSMSEVKEFILPTRDYDEVSEFIKLNDLGDNVRLIPYSTDKGFNPARGFNIGVRKARYGQIIITSPEVKPLSNVLEQFSKMIGQNVIAQVLDQDESANQTVLVSQGYRGDSPAMYFLAMFNKKDIETINGWDEEFMKGYAYEDDDFGARWNRAKLPFVVCEDIQALHLYHPRSETIAGGLGVNFIRYSDNTAAGIIQPQLGLKKL